MIVVLKNLGTLTLLLIAFPFNLAVVSIAWLWSRATQPFAPKIAAEHPKTILLTGGKMTKALQLARLFHQAGHRVILVETHKYWLSGHRFSNAIARFYTVPAPEKDPEGYTRALTEIVTSEKVDAFIPVSSPVASYYDAVAATHFPPTCEAIHFSPETTQMLDDKFSLCQKARELGLSAPKSFLITDVEQILNFDFQADGSRYILKSLKYDSVLRLDLTQLPFDGMEAYVKRLPISPERPWTMQEFITGQEYCTHSTVRNGKVRLHCCSKSSPFQVNYEHVERPEILAWVRRFAGELNLTGQLSFDFIQTEDGTVYPIECNPRTHSAITMFYDRPELAAAYLEDDGDSPPLEPLPQSKPTYWLYHEIWRLTEVRSSADFRAWLQKISRGTDAIFQGNDPLPFLLVHHWQIPLLLLDNLRRLRGWVRIDFNIGKLVELGGD
ncbi:MAG TPA: ATP-grasp enzyme [Oscillatoriales cyanobacterium M59_W2019_021]|nr:MAG: ATP-grasp enzyme [Cyanobacteria bacterium J055]HIK32633.1 ATP-grasp enzyme [Oscillatoriales cyanobacterium M4454_W2019_049]HIK50616.1 ATP-grasp enzyme [Oscillatoriales cyanobacterium M59_W2019_021]